MGEETIQFGAEQRKRALVLNQLLEGLLTIGEAAEVLGLSARQAQRLKAGYRRTGPTALVHGNQGRLPWHAVSAEIRARVVGRQYAGRDQAARSYTWCSPPRIEREWTGPLPGCTMGCGASKPRLRWGRSAL